jgi:hypothetical protein
VSRVLSFEPGIFLSRLAKQPFLVRHDLCGNALFSLAALIELAKRLPESSIEYNAGNVPRTLDPARTPRTGLSVEETIRRIEDCGSWLVIKAIERDAAYRALLERCLSEVEEGAEPLALGIEDLHGFIFVSSPGSVTPYHMDPEENFLLQLRGRKTIHVFDARDRSVLSEQELEHLFSGAHRNLVYREEYEGKAQAFELTPGLGVHVPFTAPHWVQNGPEVSISFSITFHTRASVMRKHAYSINARLRNWGINPAPVGRSPARDYLKQFVSRARQKVVGKAKRP